VTKFAGKVVIVTGAGSGIGEATAGRFSRDGAVVVLVGRTAAKLEDVARELDPARTLIHSADISDQSAAEAMVAATLERFGRLDVLVNNAGLGHMDPFLEISVEDWRKVMAIDVDGVFFCTQAALPGLLETKGNIVNVSSVSGLGGDWNMSVYNTAKGAVTNLTRSLALEIGPKCGSTRSIPASPSRT